jgi:hypothetical protein
MAQVPIATGDTLSDVPGMSASSMFILKSFGLTRHDPAPSSSACG